MQPHTFTKDSITIGYTTNKRTKHEDSPLLKQVIALRDEIIAAEETMEKAIHRLNQ